MGGRGAKEGGAKEKEAEENDRFEDSNKMIQSTPISLVKVNYKHLPTTRIP